MDCRALRSCSRAIFSNSSWRPFHRPHRTNLLHTTWPVSSRRTSYSIPSGFWVVRIMAYPVDRSARSQWGVEDSALREVPGSLKKLVQSLAPSSCVASVSVGPRNVHYLLHLGRTNRAERDFGRPTSVSHQADETLYMGSTRFAGAFVDQPRPIHVLPRRFQHSTTCLECSPRAMTVVSYCYDRDHMSVAGSEIDCMVADTD